MLTWGTAPGSNVAFLATAVAILLLERTTGAFVPLRATPITCAVQCRQHLGGGLVMRLRLRRSIGDGGVGGDGGGGVGGGVDGLGLDGRVILTVLVCHSLLDEALDVQVLHLVELQD